MTRTPIKKRRGIDTSTVSLTKRQRHIFNRLIEGACLKQIAHEMNLGNSTVRTYCHRAHVRNGMTTPQIIWNLAKETA